MATYATSGYTKDAQKAIDKWGDLKIQKMWVFRVPISGFIDKTLNILSGGTWNDVKTKYGYEQFFHLYMICYMESGFSISVEKNATINIVRNEGRENGPGIERKNVDKYNGKNEATFKNPLLNNPNFKNQTIVTNSRNKKPQNVELITLKTLLDNTQNYMGADYFPYEALPGFDGRTKVNNCQVFIKSILIANKLDTQALNNFIDQNTEQIMAEIPEFTKRISKLLTDLGGHFDNITAEVKNFIGLKRGGLIKKRKKKILY